MQNQYFDGEKRELIKELPSMMADQDTCNARIQAINILVELDKYKKGAHALLRMRDMFSIGGSFTEIQSVFQAVTIS